MQSAIQIHRETRDGFDTVSLRGRSVGDLWRMWWRVGWAIVAVGAAKIVTQVRIWRDRERSRHLLTMLSEHELSDMGFTPQQAMWESNKPFWRG